MVCADTSCWIAYLEGQSGWDVDVLGGCLDTESVVMAPVVLSEMCSDPVLDAASREYLRSLPLLEVSAGYWERAGTTRSVLHRHRLRAKLADTLIAQSCLDYDLPLLTRDRDFQSFAKYTGLKVVGATRDRPARS